MYEAKRSEQRLNLSTYEIDHVLSMLKVLFSNEAASVTHVGDEIIKIEIKKKSTTGADHDLEIQFVGLIWILCYVIPRKLGLQNIILDVNHKPGLYEYVAQKYRDFFNEEETTPEKVEKIHRPSLPDEREWPEGSLDEY